MSDSNELLNDTAIRARAVGNAVFLENVGRGPGNIASWGTNSPDTAAFVAENINLVLNGLRHALADAAQKAGEYDHWARGQIDDLEKRLAIATADLTAARTKNAELNRRCQSAEGAARDTVEKARRSDGSFGRVLARWAAADSERRLAETRTAFRVLHDAADDVRCVVEMEHYPFVEGDGIGPKWSALMGALIATADYAAPRPRTGE